MKRFFIAMVAMVTAMGVFAQTQQEAFKDLLDGRLVKSQEEFEALVAKDPSNVEVNYWLGQIYLAQFQFHHNTAFVDKAKALYAKAMTATSQNPLIVVGMGHVELLEGKTAEAKAHFNAAIEASATKKNKKYGEPAVLNAIVRANSSGDSKIGDSDYAIQKATQSEELLGATPDLFTSLGVIYLKKGSEFGGQAKRAFEKALAIDENYAPAYWRVGRIFESQGNPEMYLGFYEKAISANPKFAPAYLSLYEYYKNRDVNKAKEYLDFFIANADKDRETDYFYADYLFRAGKYQESLAKGQQIEAGLKGEKYAKVYKLYAFNYDRLKDSVKAMQNMEKYLAEELPENLSAEDYAMMAAGYLKVPGNVVKAETAAEKAITMDTTTSVRVAIMDKLANAYEAQRDWVGQFKWLDRKNALQPDNSARGYYLLADAAFKAKAYEACQRIATAYVAAYPDQPQGYVIKTRSAVAADPDTSKGTAIPAVDEYISYLMKDTAKNKNRIISQHGYKIYYYIVKAQDFQKALEAAEAILALSPTDAYGQQAKDVAEKQLKAKGQRPSAATSAGKTNAVPGGGSGSAGTKTSQ